MIYGINRALSTKSVSLTGYFLIFGPFSVNSGDGRVGDLQFLKCSDPANMAGAVMLWSKSLKSTFF